jgi:hypothetical protein
VQGDDAKLATASKEFLKMLVAIAVAAIAYAGVKGNVGNALKISSSMPMPMPAMALAGGGRIGGEGAGTAVAIGGPAPLTGVGASGAMMVKHEGEGGGSSKNTDRAAGGATRAAPELSTLNAPVPRHRAANVKMKTVAKADNTVIEPGIDVASDVAAIRAGQVPRLRGQYTVNGRVYGEHGGTLYPISGTGFHYLTRAQFKALGVYNEFGNTARAAEILNNMGIAPADRAAALRIHEVIQ